MGGAIPLLPHTSSWRGAWLSTGTNLPLRLLITFSYDFVTYFGFVSCSCIWFYLYLL